MKKIFLILLFSLFSQIGFGKSQSYLNSDYYQVQDIIWNYGDSITHIDYENRIIFFTNQGPQRFYIGKVHFNTEWISIKTETQYINYYKGYSIKKYLETFQGISGIKVVGRCYYLHDICYQVIRKGRKLIIREI